MKTKLREVAVLLAVLVFLIGCETMFAFGDEREVYPAIVMDKSGAESSEVTLFHFEAKLIVKFDAPKYRGAFPLFQYIAIHTGNFDVAIPFSCIVSVQVKDDKDNTCEVKYLWMGKQRTISGKLAKGELEGKDDFGGFSLQSNKLKELKFTKAPVMPDIQKYFKNRISHNVDVVFADGNMIRLTHFQREYYRKTIPTFGTWYWMDNYHHDTNFPFLTGELKRSVDFDEIERIEFQQGQEKDIIPVTVTLKNGNSTKGKFKRNLSASKGENLDGFTGVCDKGYLFIHPEYLKSIEFLKASKPEEK